MVARPEVAHEAVFSLLRLFDKLTVRPAPPRGSVRNALDQRDPVRDLSRGATPQLAWRDVDDLQGSVSRHE
jgi:hypothetical protein